jgi:LysR family transcriptional activator of nhaA
MLNYRQLYYFWTVARTGGIARAAERLHLTPQTISGQIGELERALGTELFTRAGRRIDLTAAGKRALSQAEEIFHLGQELEASLRHPTGVEGRVFRVGIADVVSKSLAYQLLAPVLALPDSMRLVCHEDKLERLFAALSVHALDLVIADRRLPPELGVKAFSHLLGRCTTVFQATSSLAHHYRPRFPQSLDGAPMLVPAGGAALRGSLERWFTDTGIAPRIVGEFDDTALMKAFGQAGVGIFPTATVMAREVEGQYQVEAVGRTDAVAVRYYAITTERRITHPAVAAITEAARKGLFSGTEIVA